MSAGNTSAILIDIARAERLDQAADLVFRALNAILGTDGDRRDFSVRSLRFTSLLSGQSGMCPVLRAEPTPAAGADHLIEGAEWVSADRADVDLLRRALAGGPVLLDVNAGRARALPGGRPVSHMLTPDAWKRLLYLADGGPYTQVVVLPARDAASGLKGLVGVVLDLSLPTSFMEWWRSDGRMIEDLVTQAGPYLVALSASVDGRCGEGLPVVGRQMERVLRSARAFAKLDELVLLRGPSGCGKTRLAEWIHRTSTRSKGPFVVADLLGMPESGQDAALFGVEHRTFTDVRAQTGWIRQAEGGTLFIDEIDKLALSAQARLLRFIDTREYQVLGGESRNRANVRLVVASNADLGAEVVAGRFLGDLFHRVNVLTLRVPALKERPDEIVAWAQYFLGQCAAESQLTLSLDDEARWILEQQDWPGNLRELHNVVRRSFAFAVRDLAEGRQAGGALVVRAAVVLEALQQETTGEVHRPAPEAEPGPSMAEDTLMRAELVAVRQACDELLRIARLRRAAGLTLSPRRLDAMTAGRVLESMLIVEAVRHGNGTRTGFDLLGLGARLKAGNASRDLRNARAVLARHGIKDGG